MLVVLASGSPWRKQLFSYLKIPFKVIKSDFDEDIYKKSVFDLKKMVKVLSLEKAKKVVEDLKKEDVGGRFIVIAADTTAALKDGKGGFKHLDKPRNRKEAKRMSLLMRGNWHFIHTGLTVMNDSGKKKSVVCTSRVFFQKLF